MKIEIREQKPGDPWPSGAMWETPNATNLRQICSDLTEAEIAQLVRAEPGRPALRLAHAMADRIVELIESRGEDVMIVKRSVVQLRRVVKGVEVPVFDGATDHERDVQLLRWLAPALSESDANAVLAQLAGQPRTHENTLAAIKAYVQTMGPVEFVMVDEPSPRVTS